MDAQFNPLQQSPEVVELVNSYFEIAVDFVSSSDILAALLSQVAGAMGLHAVFLQGAAPIYTSRIKKNLKR